MWLGLLNFLFFTIHTIRGYYTTPNRLTVFAQDDRHFDTLATTCVPLAEGANPETDLAYCREQYSGQAEHFPFRETLFGKTYIFKLEPVKIPLNKMVNVFIPKTIMLSGFDVHPTTGEGLMVTINLMLMVAVFAFSTIRKWVREDRVKKTIVAMDAAGHQRKFSKLVLNVWDHSMTDVREVEDLKGSITQQLKMLLHDLDKSSEMLIRTNHEKYVLWAHRALGLLLYTGLQAGGWVAIIYLQKESDTLAQRFRNIPLLAPLSNLIVPIGVSVINIVVPPVIKKIVVKIERWDNKRTEMKHLVARTVIAKINNIIVQLVGFALLSDFFLLNGTELTRVSDNYVYDDTIRTTLQKRYVGIEEALPYDLELGGKCDTNGGDGLGKKGEWAKQLFGAVEVAIKPESVDGTTKPNGEPLDDEDAVLVKGCSAIVAGLDEGTKWVELESCRKLGADPAALLETYQQPCYDVDDEDAFLDKEDSVFYDNWHTGQDKPTNYPTSATPLYRYAGNGQCTLEDAAQKGTCPVIEPNHVTYHVNSYQCRFDRAGAGLFQLMLVDFVVRKIAGMAWAVINKVKARAKGDPRHFRSEFQVSVAMVNLLYFQMLAILSQPLFPFSVMVSGLLFLGDFKFDKFRLAHFQHKPVQPWNPKDAGSFFIKFYVIILVIGGAGYHVILNNSMFSRTVEGNTDYTSPERTGGLPSPRQLSGANVYDHYYFARVSAAGQTAGDFFDGADLHSYEPTAAPSEATKAPTDYESDGTNTKAPTPSPTVRFAPPFGTKHNDPPKALPHLYYFAVAASRFGRSDNSDATSVKTGDVNANVPKYQEASVTVYNAEHARVCDTKLTGSDARMTPASNFPSRAYLQCETDADCKRTAGATKDPNKRWWPSTCDDSGNGSGNNYCNLGPCVQHTVDYQYFVSDELAQNLNKLFFGVTNLDKNNFGGTVPGNNAYYTDMHSLQTYHDDVCRLDLSTLGAGATTIDDCKALFGWKIKTKTCSKDVDNDKAQYCYHENERDMNRKINEEFADSSVETLWADPWKEQINAFSTGNFFAFDANLALPNTISAGVPRGPEDMKRYQSVFQDDDDRDDTPYAYRGGTWSRVCEQIKMFQITAIDATGATEVKVKKQGIPVIKRNGAFTAEDSYPATEETGGGGCSTRNAEAEPDNAGRSWDTDNTVHCVRWEMTVQTADEFWKTIENDADEKGVARDVLKLFDGYNRVEALCMPMARRRLRCVHYRRRYPDSHLHAACFAHTSPSSSRAWRAARGSATTRATRRSCA